MINSRSRLKRIFSGTNGTWKSYLQHILSSAGDCSFLTATTISRITQFLLNFIGNFWKTIIWTNKEITVENKPVYYKHYVNARVICIQDLNSTDSYNQLSKKICKTNILEWAGLRRSISLSLRRHDGYPSINSTTFVVGDNIFDVTKGK